MRVGGPGITVQIDESVVYRAKHHRGHALYRPPQWVLGIYDVEQKKGLTLVIPNRKSSTLMPLINRHVLHGTEIHTDMWRGYLPLSQTPFPLTYVHKVVNHSRFFLDTITGVHTNNVEAYWSSVKKKLKSMNGSRRTLISSYLYEHMYRQHYFLDDADNMAIFMRDFAQYHQ